MDLKEAAKAAGVDEDLITAHNPNRDGAFVFVTSTGQKWSVDAKAKATLLVGDPKRLSVLENPSALAPQADSSLHFGDVAPLEVEGIPVTYDGDPHPETGLEIFEGHLVDHDANVGVPSPGTFKPMEESAAPLEPSDEPDDVPEPKAEPKSDMSPTVAAKAAEESTSEPKPKAATKKAPRKRAAAKK